MRVRGAVVVVIVLGLVAASLRPPMEASADVSGPCVAGDAEEAAAGLVGEQATIDEITTIAGLEVAIAIDHQVIPGFATALLAVDGRWCSVEAFNSAASAHLPEAAPSEIAAAFASVAVMPYLGRVAVRDVETGEGVVTLVTAGGRHGATSEWTIDVDEQGVAAAMFTTTEWDADAVVNRRHADDRSDEDVLADGSTGSLGASTGALEGITSLPGHTRTFTRGDDGRVVIDATVEDLWEASVREREESVARAADMAGRDPGDDLAHEFADGVTIKVSYGLSPYTPDSGSDTGVAQADRLRTIFSGMIDHYEDFLRWGASDPFDHEGRTLAGMDTGLPEQAGYINVDSPLAVACLACAFRADAIEVHIALLFPEIVTTLVDISYPDHEKFIQTVVGHEMVHGLQSGYGDTEIDPFGSAFVEGTARASESLHDIAQVSHQPGAIHYVPDANGCEGFARNHPDWIEAQADGPFAGHTYDACYFWWTYFAHHGPKELIELIKAMPEALETTDGSATAHNLRLLEIASKDDSAALDLARWGAAAAAGNDAAGYTIPAGQTGDRLNWFKYLSAAPRAAELAASQPVQLADGGIRAYEVADTAIISELPANAAAYAFTIEDGELVPENADEGTKLESGQTLVLAAPTAGPVEGTLAVQRPGPSKALPRAAETPSRGARDED